MYAGWGTTSWCPGPRRGTLIFSYIGSYIGSDHFWGVRILNSIFWGIFRNMNIFEGMKILYIYIYFFFFFFFFGGGGHHKIGLVLGAFLCILGSFLR